MNYIALVREEDRYSCGGCPTTRITTRPGPSGSPAQQHQVQLSVQESHKSNKISNIELGVKHNSSITGS